MSFGLIFSGQGTQHPGMLPWLADSTQVRATCAELGVDDWRRALEDREWTERNAVAQTLLTGLSLAAWEQLAPALGQPAAVAGYSVGELAAFSVAGVFDSAMALHLARERAQAMDRCAQRFPGGLLAVSDLDASALDEVISLAGDVAVSIRNDSRSVVLGGSHAALASAASLVEARGGHGTRLRVRVAAHTPWMRDAAASFADTLAAVAMRAPQLVLFSNAADRVRSVAEARTALAAQIDQTVRWDRCMDDLHDRQPRCVLEIGAGQSLARMWQGRFPDVPVRSCEEFRSAQAITDWVTAQSSK